MKGFISGIVVLVMLTSCGLYEEMNNVQSEEKSIGNENCSRLADMYDDCVIGFCKSLKYYCGVCSCMNSKGSDCVYSAHRKLDNCSEEENEEAYYKIESVYCSDYLNGFENLCPPPSADVCNREHDYCITSNYDNGICIMFESGNGNRMACLKTCNSIGYSTDCYTAEEICYSGSVISGGVCILSGDKGENESCNYLNDCKKGYMCLSAYNEETECYKICRSNSECGINKSCIDTGLGYSVCYEK